MTTTVKIYAHCSSDKEVHVLVYDAVTGEPHEKFVLQDGEQAERVVYDNRVIKTNEALKV